MLPERVNRDICLCIASWTKYISRWIQPWERTSLGNGFEQYKKKHPGKLTHGSSHKVGWWYRRLAVDGWLEVGCFVVVYSLFKKKLFVKNVCVFVWNQSHNLNILGPSFHNPPHPDQHLTICCKVRLCYCGHFCLVFSSWHSFFLLPTVAW